MAQNILIPEKQIWEQKQKQNRKKILCKLVYIFRLQNLSLEILNKQNKWTKVVPIHKNKTNMMK